MSPAADALGLGDLGDVDEAAADDDEEVAAAIALSKDAVLA